MIAIDLRPQLSVFFVLDGRGDWIRTSDLPVPNRTLYQAEPRPDITTRLPFQPPFTRFLGPEPSALVNFA